MCGLPAVPHPGRGVTRHGYRRPDERCRTAQLVRRPVGGGRRVLVGPDLPGPPHRPPDRLRGPARRAQGAPAGDAGGRGGGPVRGHAGDLGGGGVHPGPGPAVPGLVGAPGPDPRGRRHLRGGPHRRSPGHVGPGQGGRGGAGRHHPLLHGGDLVPVQDPPGRPGPAVPGVDAAAHRPVGHRHHQRRQPHRRPRRPGRRGGGHRLGGPGRLRPAPPAPRDPPDRQHRAAHRRRHLRHLPRVPAPQLPSGQDLHGRRRGPGPRAC